MVQFQHKNVSKSCVVKMINHITCVFLGLLRVVQVFQ